MGTTGKALSIAKFEFETHFQHYSLIVVFIKICRFKTFRVDVLHKEHSPPFLFNSVPVRKLEFALIEPS